MILGSCTVIVITLIILFIYPVFSFFIVHNFRPNGDRTSEKKRTDYKFEAKVVSNVKEFSDVGIAHRTAVIILGVCTVIIIAAISYPIFMFILYKNFKPNGHPTTETSVKHNFQAKVVSNVKECSDVGMALLKDRDATAVEAAIATLFCQGVTMPQSMGLGGGFLMTIYKQSEEKPDFLIARESAPEQFKPDMFKTNASLSRKGILSVAVPGELRGYWAAYNKYKGTVSWRELIKPSIDLCTNGIRVTRYFAKVLQRQKDAIKKDPGLQSVYINSKTGEPYLEGEVYTHPKLAESLIIISEEGGDAMHDGKLTEKIVNEIVRRGGIITEDDMHSYRTQWEHPVTKRLDMGRVMYTAPLPGSGIILSFMLNLLQGYGPLDPMKVTTYQRIVEAFKFGFGIRTKFGDPKFLNKIEKELSEDLIKNPYADQIRGKISDDKTSRDASYYDVIGDLSKYQDTSATDIAAATDQGTANVVVLASNGDAVSVTSTINLCFGAGILLEDTGFILNDQMDDFSWPDLTNAHGIPPSPKNYIARYKRPMSSMTPTIVVRQKKPILIVGAAGGPKITTALALIIMRHFWFNMSIEAAVAEKRFHHQLFPMTVQFDKAYENHDNFIVKGLQKIGHQTEYVESDGILPATAIADIYSYKDSI